MIDGVATKNAAPVACSPYLSVPVRVDDEVTGSRKFSLVSGICHSGTLTSGHYSAFVRDNCVEFGCTTMTRLLQEQLWKL